MQTTRPINTNKFSALPVGYRLGEYTIAAVLGEGGFGITYRARDTKLGLDVAIKEYFPGIYATRTDASTIVPRPGTDLDNYKWGLSEFLKEAQALAKFKHPHIVRVLRFLEANGTAYTIMEYEEGETLSSYLRKHGGVLGEPRLLQIFLPILNGLQAVHDAGLLHLDIKPDNIYLRGYEHPMLIDFGSSRQMRGDTGGKVTLTPGYCALEQYPGHGDISVASDVYGMGATLYRCITGKAPVDALERERAAARTRIDPLPPAASFERPVYSPHIRDCIDRALMLAAAERPASAYALQQGLMGKDMSKAPARTPTAMLHRPGTGYIGTVLPAEKQKVKRRRYTFFEKFVALAVFVGTFAVVTPKLLIDTGQIDEAELYQWIDSTQTQVVERAQEFGDFVNERLFGVPPRPKVVKPVALKRPAPAEPEPVAAPALTPPFGTDKQLAIDIAMPEQVPRALGFLQHGAILATAADDGVVRLWDVQTGTPRKALATRVLAPAALAVFPNTQWVAAMDQDQSIAVFDPLGNPEFVLTPDSPHDIVAMTVSQTGRLLAEAAEDGSVTIWEISQKRRLQKISTGKTRPDLLLFAPDERTLATVEGNGGLSLWGCTDGKLLSHRRAHTRPIVTTAFAPDGRRIATADGAGELRIWTVPAPGLEWPPALTPADVPRGINRVAFSPDGAWLLATANDGNIHVWNAETGTAAHKITTDRRRLRSLALTSDGKWLAAVADENAVRVWK